MSVSSPLICKKNGLYSMNLSSSWVTWRHSDSGVSNVSSVRCDRCYRNGIRGCGIGGSVYTHDECIFPSDDAGYMEVC